MKSKVMLSVLMLTCMALNVNLAWGAEETKTYGWEVGDDASLWEISEAISAQTGTGNTGTGFGKINTANTYVQFKEKVKLTKFSFALKRTSSNSNYNVYIETSEDGINWVAAYTYAMSSFGNGSYTTKTESWDGTNEYYVRVHVYQTTATRNIDDISITYIVGSSGGVTYTDVFVKSIMA